MDSIWAYFIVGGLIVSAIVHAYNMYEAIRKAGERKDHDR
jgi:hypothetical protein